MEIIVVSSSRERTWRISFDPAQPRNWVLPLAVLLLAALSVFCIGYWVRAEQGGVPRIIAKRWDRELQAQRTEIKQARADAEANAHALARRIAMIDAEIVRLDTAGSRMATIAHLDPGEFSFDQLPALGGPGTDISSMVNGDREVMMADAIKVLDAIDARLVERERDMKVLEQLLLQGKLQREVQPSGWPIETGYITSGYGARADPFSGGREYHQGIDFSAPAGTDVLAVASGIVSAAEPRDGYGVTVEINHGNGYMTRYGHNATVLVKPGDRVQRGQAIARIGMTGRSTGPHVHFEVLHNGAIVDPDQFIHSAR